MKQLSKNQVLRENVTFRFPDYNPFSKLLFSLPAHGLQCYTDVAATEITVCKENEGFRTCFTKYNDSKLTRFILAIIIYYSIVTAMQLVLVVKDKKQDLLHKVQWQ